MTEATKLVWRRSVILWIGAGLVTALNYIAATFGDQTLTYGALAVTGMFALFGIGFGIWAGRTLAGSS